MYIENELLKLENKVNVHEITNRFIENLRDVVIKFISDKSMFSLEDFSVHVLDEYVLETNCHKDIFTCIYLEIDQPLNYRMDTKKKKIKSGKYTVPDMYINLTEIKKRLTECLLTHFDSNNIIWLDKYSICIKSTVLYEEGLNENYYFRLIPCFTHYSKDNVRGVMYYSNNDIEIEYPQQAITNYFNKNEETNDKYRQAIVICKNLLRKEKDIDRLPSEIIETLLYNVPNTMLKSIDRQSMLNVINFIRNNPITSFKTIDEQDYAFSSLYRSMSIYYCKHILKILEKHLTK